MKRKNTSKFQYSLFDIRLKSSWLKIIWYRDHEEGDTDGLPKTDEFDNYFIWPFSLCQYHP
jgi:hypothetical protein